MKKLLKKILFRNTEVTEYPTISITNEIVETVYLETKLATWDISANHYVLCLDPIVFGVWIENNDRAKWIAENLSIKINFYRSADKTGRNIVAAAKVEFKDKIEEASGTLLLLKLRSCKIFHANSLKRSILFNRYYKKPNLSFEYYRSLICAYSYPRRVRVISFKEDDYYNIFPMDLVGDIQPGNRYVFGLRHTNITLAKIIETKKIVVSEFPAEQKNTIYQLGKHHGSSPPSLSSLPFRTMLSRQYKFYVPEWTDSYKEIKIIKTIDLGSHMLLWGEVINEQVVKAPTDHLYHIHFFQYYHQRINGFDHTLV